jgi:hypothetical protein
VKIPRKFKLFGHEIDVQIQEKLNSHDGKWGSVNFTRKRILLEKDIDKDFQEQTFLHELVHLIFDFLCEKELADNEKIVNGFSELLYQALETMEY